MGKILVTGAAGFIGAHLCSKLCEEGFEVIGIDNLNNYYDIELKKARLEYFNDNKFIFKKIDLVNKDELMKLFKENNFSYVINLAAQAGVRYSIDNPDVYIESNIIGFYNILECCRTYPVKHLLYASSSSVYGANEKIPFSECDIVDKPVSLYAATKKSNELMAHSYSSLYKIPTTGLRFFTVYGPWGRPDMAYFSFSEKIIKGESIKIFNSGKMERDFTYIDDVVNSIVLLVKCTPCNNSTSYRILNIGNNNPVKLLDFIETLEEKLGVSAKKEYVDMQLGDVKKTYADTKEIYELINYLPKIKIDVGLEKFAKWFKEYKKN